MNGTYLLPFLVLFPMVGALAGYLLGKRSKSGRDFFAMVVTGITLLSALSLYNKGAEFAIGKICGMGLSFTGDGFRIVLTVLASFVWFMTTVFSKEYFHHYRNRNRYYFFMQMTLGATLGVFLSGDLFTTFIFFEIMSFTSYALVVHDESDKAKKAAQTYLGVAVFGGLVTLMGLFLFFAKTGTLNMGELAHIMEEIEDKRAFYIPGILVLVGFGAKAGLFPLHIWLPEAHPVAPAPGSALLSCILTKTGVYGVLVLSCVVFLHDKTWGMGILVLGVITMVLGAVLAVFSIDLKRTLACSSLSQIGFIMVGTGMQGILGHHNAIAAAGTILHLANHSLLKLVLFMSAGVIYMNTHKLNLNDLRGYGKDKPLLKGIFLMGVLGITGIPFWNGYISKTLLHESIVEYIHLLEEAHQSLAFFQGVEILFLFSGGLTIAYMTKIFVAIFIESPTEQAKTAKKPYMNPVSLVVLAGAAVILPILGMLPHITMDRIYDIARGFMHGELPAHPVEYFAWVNLKGAVISIAVGAVVYFGFIRLVLMKQSETGVKEYIDIIPDWFSLEDKVYRPVLLTILPFIGAMVARIVASVVDGFIYLCRVFIFNMDDGKVIPEEDAYFSTYTHEAGEHYVFREGLAKSLLLFGVGVTVAMLYMLL